MSVLMASMKISMAGVCQLRSVHVNMVALLMEEVNKSRLNVRSGKNHRVFHCRSSVSLKCTATYKINV